ncbi:homeobox protein 2-like [Vespula squamosa]|uniref:Homeobox protein 2-like n=1 Tax=Vespula squamosa TaxID=30214 RepID=A0ABD2BLV2_VESSQ
MQLINLSTAAPLPDSAGMVEMVNGLAYGGIPYGSVSGMLAKYPGFSSQQAIQSRRLSTVKTIRPVIVTPNFRATRLAVNHGTRPVQIYNLPALWKVLGVGSVTKSTINPDILTTFAKNVASVLTPTLLGELSTNRSNRSFLELSSITKTNSKTTPRSLSSSKDNVDEATTPEIYREKGNLKQPNRFSNTRRQADDFYNSQERPNYPENSGYRQSQFYDPYNIPNNYFQSIGRGDRTDFRGNLNLGRPVNSGNFANAENIESPARFDSIYRSDERISSDGIVGRPFSGLNGFNGYSSFEDRQRGDIRYHHSPLPIGGHYFGPFGFGPHGPYHHPIGYRHPYGYPGRRPNTDSDENNNSKEETKEENGSDRPKSDDRRPFYRGYKPFYDFPPPPYKFGPGYHHHRNYNESSVDYRYDDPYYHKYYDDYYDYFFPGPFHPYGYGPKRKNGNKNGGKNGNGGGNSETQENKDTETLSASEKAEKTIDASNSEYKIKIPTTLFEVGLENGRIDDDDLEHIDPDT